MKNRLFVMLLVVMALYGCGKDDNVILEVTPIGTFTGKFTVIHINPRTKAVDTGRAVLTVQTTATGLFKVTGDTAKVHAGSHGRFGVATSPYIQFADSTATVLNPPKKHLTGVYQFFYDGSVFQMTANNDTLSVLYDLKRN